MPFIIPCSFSELVDTKNPIITQVANVEIYTLKSRPSAKNINSKLMTPIAIPKRIPITILINLALLAVTKISTTTACFDNLPFAYS
jgi:hypothetical protein